jgi:hypothetical protein
MRKPRGTTAAALCAIAALGAAHAPGEAPASGPPPVVEAEAEPGVSVTGIGFARSGDRSGRADRIAVDRAVRDARARAGAVARALGARVGEIQAVELREPGQFAGRRSQTIAAAAATVRFAILGGTTEGGAREVEAFGAGFAPVRPADADRSRSIKRATISARRLVAPEAAAAARRNAVTAAGAAGLTLGPIVSISEAPVPAYGYGSSFYDAALGSFGPGRFCGYYRRPVIRPDRRTGVPRVVGRVYKRGCTFQTTYSLHLEVVYVAAPAEPG